MEAEPTHPDVSVLFICSGNICRSPTAEGVFRRRVEEAGLGDRIRIDSAGTGSWHVGEPPDSRSQATALRRGYDLSAQRARHLKIGDCRKFDLLIVMDSANHSAVRRLCVGHGKLHRMLEFAPDSPERDVPDPYHGGPGGFDHVLDLIEQASIGLLEHLRREYLTP